MEALVLIGAVQAIFFAVIILAKKSKNTSDRILTLLLSLFAIHLGFVFYAFNQGHEFYIDYGFIPTGFLVVYYSALYVYAKSLVFGETAFKAKWLLHIVPSAIIYISLIPFALLPYEEKAAMVTHMTNDSYSKLVFGMILFFVVFYLIGIFRLLKKHKASIKRMFSYNEDINLQWILILAVLLILLFIVFSSLVAYLFYLERSTTTIKPEDHMIMDMQGHFAFVAFVFLLGFFGIKQRVIYSSPIVNKANKPEQKEFLAESRYKKSGLKKGSSEIYLKELLQYMEEGQPYLNGKLALKEVAEQLDISTNHLSQVINEKLSKNFFDFVNAYRVELVKEKMSNPANSKFTLLALAYDSGFNSKSSFNSIFKKLSGMTPSEYMLSLAS